MHLKSISCRLLRSIHESSLISLFFPFQWLLKINCKILFLLKILRIQSLSLIGNLPKYLCFWSKISHLKSKRIFHKYLHFLVSLSFFVQKVLALLNVKKKRSPTIFINDLQKNCLSTVNVQNNWDWHTHYCV